MLRTIILTTALFIAACSPEVQSTSGRAYLAESGIVDPEVAKFAAYESDLSFPARTGVVRLVYGDLTNMPDNERALYTEGLTDALGSVVHLGPLEANMLEIRRYGMNQLKIRQLAASRHLDYVLVVSYDPGSNTAEALFLDVGNGYPYASIETVVPGRGKRNFWGGEVGKPNRLNRATLKLAKHLKPKLETMVEELVKQAST